MKKIITTAIVISTFAAFCQPYGQTQYPCGSVMSWGGGGRTGINPGNSGFIMVGSSNPTGSSILHVEKTQSGGIIPSAVGPFYSFQANYTIVENGGCLSTNLPVTSCVGANIIEIPQLNYSAEYVMAGAYNKACFITYLNPDGDIHPTYVYPFPGTATQLNKPPCIVQDQLGYTYVCGQYNSYMYAMKIGAAGAVIWSHFYDAGNNLFEPRAMIISPFNSDVVIVGHFNPDPIYGRTSDGFFLNLDETNGNVTVFVDYNSTPCNWFNAVTPSNNTLGGHGFIVGGYTDATVGNIGVALMMKLDVSGNIVWNTLITNSSTGISANEITGVVERKNALGVYEYYGVSQSYDNLSAYPVQLSDMTVFKLDNAGVPFSMANPGQMDEFHYPATNGAGFNPRGITSLPVGAGADEGLHVYANNSGSFYLLESYFNGVTGCNENLTTIASYETGPIATNMTLQKFGSFNPCTNLIVNRVSGSSSPNQICTSSSLPAGSNAKPVATGLKQLSGNAGIQLYPNPGNGLYTIELNAPAEITVYNLLGEELFREKLSEGKNQVDLSGKENGVYMIKIFSGSKTETIRLIKN